MAVLTRAQILKAIDGALRARSRAGYNPNEPVCVFDLAEKLGAEVRFVGGNSFGGMYVKDFERVLVPAKRPPGRQSFTCAHELGHWHFGHGTRVELIDELDKGGSEDPDERMANVFASYLLMPKWAVEEALRRRSLVAARCHPLDCYRVANQLGVGYATLVGHLHTGLRMIPESLASSLLHTTPKDIRQAVLGTSEPRHLVMADRHWWRVAIDLAVGDALVVPANAHSEGAILKSKGTIPHGAWFEAIQPGIGRIADNSLGWSSYVRVARREYVGRSKFRFLEDPDVNESP